MSRKFGLIILACAVSVTVVSAALQWEKTRQRPNPSAMTIYAQDSAASPSGTIYYPLPTLEPTPLIINRVPEDDYIPTPELPLITNMRKFLYFLAELFGVRLPAKNSGLDVYSEPLQTDR